MATTILDLPDETLTEILRFFARDWASLHTLTLTCRRISTIARELLYREPHLARGQIQYYHCREPKLPDSAVAPDEPSRHELLLRTWRETPILLLQQLKKFTFFCMYYPKGSELPQLLPALSRASNLRVLRLEQCWIQDIEDIAGLYQRLSCDPFPNLQALQVDWILDRPQYLASAVLVSLFSNRALRTIQIRSGFDYGRDTPYSDLAIPPRGSGLTNLDLTQLLFSSVSLESILLAATRLENLKVSIPEDMVALEQSGCPRDGWFEIWSSIRHRTLDPQRIGEFLWPVHKSLQSLTLTNPRGVVIKHVGSQIDLSAFRSLKNLQISSALLLGNTPCMKKLTKIAFIRLLPPNLVFLCVYFDTLQGIFHSIEDLETACADKPVHPNFADLWNSGPGNRSAVVASFSWLKDLTTQCKMLKGVELQETHHTNYLIRRRNDKSWTSEGMTFGSVDVVATTYPELFADLPFRCKISVYVDLPTWWSWGWKKVGKDEWRNDSAFIPGT